MLPELKFVIGAVARKDYDERLCHLLIKDQRVIAYDGMLAMSSPIAMDLHVKPHARDFMKAVAACPDGATISMHVTPAGRLSLKAGKFKSFVRCLPDENDMVMPLPEGDLIDVSPEMIAAITAVAPFMGIDASRQFAMGVRLEGGCAIATNNIVVVQRWHGAQLPYDVTVPADAVRELIRNKRVPTKMQVTPNSTTFHYEDGKWLRTQLIADEWPSKIAEIFERVDGVPAPIPSGFYEALATLKAFSDTGHVHMIQDGLGTSPVDGEGTSVDVADLPIGPCFYLPQLLLLEGVATHADFSTHPAPCPFKGPLLRGVIVGPRI